MNVLDQALILVGVFFVVLAVVVLYNLWCEWCFKRWKNNGPVFNTMILVPMVVGIGLIAILDWMVG
jgi:hypothetical protein